MKPTLLRSRSATKGPKKRQSHNKSTSFTVARGSDAPLFEALCCFSDEIARIDSFEGQRRKKRGKLHLRRWRVTHTPHPSYTVLLACGRMELLWEQNRAIGSCSSEALFACNLHQLSRKYEPERMLVTSPAAQLMPPLPLLHCLSITQPCGPSSLHCSRGPAASCFFSLPRLSLLILLPLLQQVNTQPASIICLSHIA